jgi:hypothetical protein
MDLADAYSRSGSDATINEQTHHASRGSTNDKVVESYKCRRQQSRQNQIAKSKQHQPFPSQLLTKVECWNRK